VRKNHDEAETLYRKALELDPSHANNTGNFANFLTNVRKNHDEAETLYRRALELDPSHANHTRNFASFLTNVRQNHDEAEVLYRKALELDPSDAKNAQDLAAFLATIRKLYAAAVETLEPIMRNAPADPCLLTAVAEYRICEGRPNDAIEILERARLLIQSDDQQNLCFVLLNLAIVRYLCGESPDAELDELTRLLRTDFPRKDSDMEFVFEAIGDKLPPRIRETLQAYAAAVANADRSASLGETLTLIEKEFTDDSGGNGKPPRRNRRTRRSGDAKIP